MGRTTEFVSTQLTVGADARSLAGVIPGTCAARDWDILRWIGRMGAVTLDQLRFRFGVGRTVAYRRSAVLVEAGLVERVPCVPGQARLLRATQRGLRMAGLSGRVAPAPPDLNGHHLACGWVAIALEHEHGVEAVMSERDLRMVEGLSVGGSAVLGSASIRRGAAATSSGPRGPRKRRRVAGGRGGAHPQGAAKASGDRPRLAEGALGRRREVLRGGGSDGEGALSGDRQGSRRGASGGCERRTLGEFE